MPATIDDPAILTEIKAALNDHDIGVLLFSSLTLRRAIERRLCGQSDTGVWFLMFKLRHHVIFRQPVAETQPACVPDRFRYEPRVS